MENPVDDEPVAACLLTIDARIVIASVDTYLRFAEAVNRLDLSESENQLTDMAG